MSFITPVALFLASAMLAAATMFISICRLNAMRRTTRPSIGMAYTLLLAASGLCLVAPLVWYMPVTLGQVAMQSAIVWRLVADVRRSWL